MKSLPILALLTAAFSAVIARAQAPPPTAAGASQAATASGPQGDAMIAQVVANLDALPAISAKIRHRVQISGRTIIGTGEYLQQGRGWQRAYRLNIELRTSLFATSIEHVCDGQRLWMFEELDEAKDLTVIDVARLQRARAKSQASPPSPMPWISLGGLPKLALGLKQSFHFGEVVQSRLDDLPVWTIEGKWKSPRLAQLLPEQADTIKSGGQADLNQLTPNVPHRVVLHLGCDDLFPYRIEYWRTDTGPEGENLKPVQKLMAVVEWYEVRLGVPVDPSRFVYRPPDNLTPVDRTSAWLDRLGLEDPPPAEANRRPRSRR